MTDLLAVLGVSVDPWETKATARDGDGDGFVYDGTPGERPVTPAEWRAQHAARIRDAVADLPWVKVTDDRYNVYVTLAEPGTGSLVGEGGRIATIKRRLKAAGVTDLLAQGLIGYRAPYPPMPGKLGTRLSRGTRGSGRGRRTFAYSNSWDVTLDGRPVGSIWRVKPGQDWEYRVALDGFPTNPRRYPSLAAALDAAEQARERSGRQLLSVPSPEERQREEVRAAERSLSPRQREATLSDEVAAAGASAAVGAPVTIVREQPTPEPGANIAAAWLPSGPALVVPPGYDLTAAEVYHHTAHLIADADGTHRGHGQEFRDAYLAVAPPSVGAHVAEALDAGGPAAADTSGVQHQDTTPLDYRGKFPGQGQRLYLTEPGYDGKRAAGNWQGTPTDVTSFLDYSVVGDDVYVWFLHTRGDRENQGNAGRLVQALYDAYPGKRVEWGELMDSGAEVLYKRFRASHPEQTGKGYVWGRWLTGDPPRLLDAADVAPDRHAPVKPLAEDGVGRKDALFWARNMMTVEPGWNWIAGDFESKGDDAFRTIQMGVLEQTAREIRDLPLLRDLIGSMRFTRFREEEFPGKSVDGILGATDGHEHVSFNDRAFRRFHAGTGYTGLLTDADSGGLALHSANMTDLARYTTVHEFGHVVAFSVPQGTVNRIMGRVAEELPDVGQPVEGGGWQMSGPGITAALSKYGASSLHEFLAEGWAEYRLAERPRPLARIIGEELEADMGSLADGPADQISTRAQLTLALARATTDERRMALSARAAVLGYTDVAMSAAEAVAPLDMDHEDPPETAVWTLDDLAKPGGCIPTGH